MDCVTPSQTARINTTLCRCCLLAIWGSLWWSVAVHAQHTKYGPVLIWIHH